MLRYKKAALVLDQRGLNAPFDLKERRAARDLNA
jgi:hypothetical protein